MSTTLTPPPSTPPAAIPSAAGGTPSPEGRTAPHVISLLTIVAGGTLVLGTVAWSVFSTVAAGRVETSDLHADTRGVTAVAVSVDAADLTVRFDDVAEAELSVTGSRGAGEWTLERRGDELVVGTDNRFWDGWWVWHDTAQATLVLPRSLEGTDASLELSAGSLRAEGDFAALDLRVDAGGLDVSGSAEALDVDVSAGSAQLDLGGVRTATLDLSAGRLSGQLTGRTPQSIEISMSAGSADLAVPPGAYAITSRTDAGSFDHRLNADPDSPNVIDVEVSAGSVELVESR